MMGTLEDREAIRDVIAAYAHALDRRRWDMMDRLFHDDAQFQFGTIVGDWRSFVEQARGILNACEQTQHHLGQVMFGFESDTVCHTETYLNAMHVIPAGYPIPEVFPDRGRRYHVIVAGRYVDRFEKRDGEWRMAQRTGLYDWRDCQEINIEGLTETPEGSFGYHDERDPSTPAAARWLG
ncbi:MAG: nuclear transport factor 2 family protein [Pseudomonadota bacterium]